MLLRIASGGALFGIHAYRWWNIPYTTHPDNYYYAFRYKLWTEACIAHSLPVPQWIATESGVDGWTNPIGYKGRMTDAEYARAIIELQNVFDSDGIYQAAWCLDAYPPFSNTFTFTGTEAVQILAEYNKRQGEGTMSQDVIKALQDRLTAEERRNAWLVEALWRIGKSRAIEQLDPDLAFHCRRLAVACAGGDERNLPNVGP